MLAVSILAELAAVVFGAVGAREIPALLYGVDGGGGTPIASLANLIGADLYLGGAPSTGRSGAPSWRCPGSCWRRWSPSPSCWQAADPPDTVELPGVKLPKDLSRPLDDLLSRAFAEDGEDVTSLAVFGPAVRVAGQIVTRERAVVAGAVFLPRIFSFLHPAAKVEVLVEDGARVTPGKVLARIEGPAITVLAAERVALNLLQRLSGIATATRVYVDAVKGTRARILDTRKTAPGLRIFEKYAVRCGRGENHRFGLAHGFLVKDNHADGAGSVWDATRRAVDFRDLNRPLRGLFLEVEARSRDEVHQALDAGAERILLDNMTAAQIQAAVADIRLFTEATGQRILVEASGGMNPERAREAALAGVDYVSVGAITHSVRAIDIGLDVELSSPRPARRPRGGRRA